MSVRPSLAAGPLQKRACVRITPLSAEEFDKPRHGIALGGGEFDGTEPMPLGGLHVAAVGLDPPGA
jgi:hypothetical protein